MPAKLLPIFQIQDFKTAEPAGPEFYLQRFEMHLKTHAFIQKPHKHDFYIILFITAGTGTHTIDFQTYPVQPNAVFFLSPGQVHSWQLSPETSGFIVFFSSAFFLAGRVIPAMICLPFFNALQQNNSFQLSPETAKTITAEFLQIEKEHKGQGWKKEDVLRNLLENLLIFLGREFKQTQKSLPETERHLSQWQAFEELVNAHFKEHLPVTFYADKLNISVKQLNEICRQTLNKTPLTLINDRLLLEAHRLLTHSALTVNQVAAELGFSDNSYFSRFFKKNTSQTPEQFRQEMK